MITLSSVTKTYTSGGRVAANAVSSVNLVVNDGDFIVVTGAPGSGKTTLLNVMAGLSTPTTGQVLYDGVEVWKLPDSQQSLFRNRHVGFVFQFPSLMPSLTLLENVLLPTTFIGVSRHEPESTRRAVKLLGEVGLADKIHGYPRELSADQRQRLVVARALIRRPDVLFADEPTRELGEQAERELIKLLQDLNRRLRLTIVLVTGNSDLIGCGTRGFQLVAGQLFECQRAEAPTGRSPRT